jgi:hypothetical protein
MCSLVARKARRETGVTPTLSDVVRACESCGAEITGGRRDRRYCSPACRTAAHRAREKADRRSHADLLDEIEDQVALALAEPRLVGLIVQAAQTNWRAAAWLLERKYESWQLGAQPAAPLLARENDPFAEIDQLAARRRQREGLPSTT